MTPATLNKAYPSITNLKIREMHNLLVADEDEAFINYLNNKDPPRGVRGSFIPMSEYTSGQLEKIMIAPPVTEIDVKIRQKDHA